MVKAGIGIFGDPLEQDPDVIDRLFRINVHAPYHAAVEAARQMPEGGRIIVIGSVNGDRMPVAGMASYALSKSARQGLARDFGQRGITVNVVQPGPIDTDANPAGGPMKELMHSFMVIKRHSRPDEVAGTVAWLAGPEASFVTGAMHTIDGAFGAKLDETRGWLRVAGTTSSRWFRPEQSGNRFPFSPGPFPGSRQMGRWRPSG